ncbi:glucosaminidase domain-containing protein [Neobacillus drentensis]|uniref:glucosaminidase domain-containing protein n=1 Tax=Neobacillus drentensis TaxID=220684 RepID=UPI00300015AD
MKKVVFRSFLVVLLLMGIFHGKVSAAETSATQQVISVKLPVFKENPNIVKAPSFAVLSLHDQVTVLEQVRNAAKIQTADGQVGWVYIEYLSQNPLNQTWLVKKERNLRDDNLIDTNIDIPSQSLVTVLQYNAATRYYKIRTTDGVEGWIYGWYLENEANQTNEGGSNVIPYDFTKVGKVTNQISLFTPLNTTSNITATEINRFIDYKTKDPSSKLKGMGSSYIEAQNVTGINAVYLLAHSGLESKWGTSDIAKAKNNFFGIGAVDSNPTDGAASFASPNIGIINGAKFINDNYVNRETNLLDAAYPYSQPTLDNMSFNNGYHQYASDEAWAGKIANIAKEFYEFTFANGETLKTGWYQEGQNKYYFDTNGKMLTGKQTINGKNYFFYNNGYLKWGWQYVSGKWYYYNEDGTYKTGWQLDKDKWYYLNSSGVMLTGWQYINGKWYYLNPAGDMKTGWLYTGGKWYFLDQSGAMKTGWVSTGGKWYYMNNSGVMLTGWVKVSGKWYYLYNDGHMAANTTIGGYRLGKDGAML